MQKKQKLVNKTFKYHQYVWSFIIVSVLLRFCDNKQLLANISASFKIKSQSAR